MTVATPPVAAHTPDEQAVLRRLAALPGAIGITVPGDVDEAWERAAEEANRASRALARMGLYLVWLHAQLPEGQFAAGLRKHDIPQAQAAHAMRVAQLLLHAQTPRARARLLDLKPTQIKVLARLDPEELVEACEQGELDLDDVASMSPRMLSDEVRRLRAAKAVTDQRLVEARLEQDRIRAEAAAPVSVAGMPASLVCLRAEACAFAEAARLDLAALARQADVFLAAPDLGTHRPEREPHVRAGARVVMQHAAGTLAEAAAVYEHLRESLSAWLPEGEWTADDQPAPLTVDEARRIRRWRDTHAERMDKDARARETGRLARGEVRRGRGRPRKSATGTR